MLASSTPPFGYFVQEREITRVLLARECERKYRSAAACTAAGLPAERSRRRGVSIGVVSQANRMACKDKPHEEPHARHRAQPFLAIHSMNASSAGVAKPALGW